MTICGKLQLVGLVCAVTLFAAEPADSAVSYIAGRVQGPDHAPLMGASVMAVFGDSAITGTATAADGTFVLRLRDYPTDTARVRVSAVGFETETAAVILCDDTVRILISLAAAEIDVGTIEVTPNRSMTGGGARLTHDQLSRTARSALIKTNPIASIQAPQVAREGSSISSRLRVNGTSPKYFINGVEIGYNPTHYGVFSVIPASVINSMTFNSAGTDARHDLPATVEFETGAPFYRHSGGEANLSLVEATGSWSYGTERYFLLGALRESVIDKIVNQFDFQSDRESVPPTDFRDLFVSSGVKLSSILRLLIDQYHVRDDLSYRTDATSGNADGTAIALHTAEHYYGLRLEALTNRALFNLRAAVRSTREEYAARSNAGSISDELRLDLAADSRSNSLAADATIIFGEAELTIGDRIEYISHYRIDMTQQNWNFLPADANSDNPFLYQPELNKLYDGYRRNRTALRNAAHLSVRYRLGRVEVVSGLRAHTFSELGENVGLAFREEVTIPTGEHSRLRLYYGTFIESPVQKVLEPYQVLIHADLDRLQPVRTTLLSAGFTTGPIHVGVFRKMIDNLPIAAPDFSKVDSSGSVIDGFIAMHSSGSTDFYGGDISFELDNLASGRLDLYGYYGYSHANRKTDVVAVPYEINAPHRLYGQINYRLSRTMHVGGDMSIRSGYTYTPLPTGADEFGPDRYDPDYYASALASENSQHFPTHAVLSLHMGFNFGSTDLYFSVANITNRGNPIISTTDGYIFDAGILPSVGMTVRF